MKPRKEAQPQRRCPCGGLEEFVESHRAGKPLLVFRCLSCAAERIPGVATPSAEKPVPYDWKERLP